VKTGIWRMRDKLEENERVREGKRETQTELYIY
jgi:hypothetical protein